MKSIKLSEFLFYKKINTVLNTAFIFMLIVSNILVIFTLLPLSKIVVFRIISFSLFSISLFFYFFYFFYFILFFYKKYNFFCKKIKSNFMILFSTIIMSILIGIICIIIIGIYSSHELGVSFNWIFEKTFFATTPMILIVSFVGISINTKIFYLWQTQKKTDFKKDYELIKNKIDK